MNITIATPAPAGTRHGNRLTALRYARLLRNVGHRVRLVAEPVAPRPDDILVALHARKSSAMIRAWRHDQVDRPIVVVLTGTDLYEDLDRAWQVRDSLVAATRIVVLQSDALRYLPREVAAKAEVIIQSAVPPPRRSRPLRRCFEVCVAGHLRNVKDPLRAAIAARRLPAESHIRVHQIGACIRELWQRRVDRETGRNPRFHYGGNLPHHRALQALARSRLVVISSRSEGAPNVASEAIACSVPILCTRISGMIGLLGSDYPGYFPVSDTAALTQLLWRAESDRVFYRGLVKSIANLRNLVRPRAEQDAWIRLMSEFQ